MVIWTECSKHTIQDKTYHGRKNAFCLKKPLPNISIGHDCDSDPQYAVKQHKTRSSACWGLSHSPKIKSLKSNLEYRISAQPHDGISSSNYPYCRGVCCHHKPQHAGLMFKWLHAYQMNLFMICQFHPQQGPLIEHSIFHCPHDCWT